MTKAHDSTKTDCDDLAVARDALRRTHEHLTVLLELGTEWRIIARAEHRHRSVRRLLSRIESQARDLGEVSERLTASAE